MANTSESITCPVCGQHLGFWTGPLYQDVSLAHRKGGAGDQYATAVVTQAEQESAGLPHEVRALVDGKAADLAKQVH